MTCSTTTSATCCETLEKYVFEKRLFVIDFSELMATGETIEESAPAPVVTSQKYNGDTTDLTITGVEVIGQTVRMWIADGSQNTRYKIQCQIETSNDQKLQGNVLLKVL